jgi:alpha-glucosidase
LHFLSFGALYRLIYRQGMISDKPWWSESVIYQIYPRSFFDSNGDGEGDLPGVTSHLEHVQALGADAIWLSPFYTSPNKDGGYDVADPRDVDPRFGSLEDARAMIVRAHQLGLRVLVDVVPNHFSDQHPWFKDAISAKAGSPERDRFHFYDAKPDGTPPNNWISLFGGPAWTQIKTADGSSQYYLHLFDSSQPDLNWENEDVASDFEETLRFWLDLGVDGFRIDVAHGLAKENILVDHHDPQGLSDALRLDAQMSAEKRGELLASVPFFDRDGVHAVYRNWRKLFDSYQREIMAVAEAWVHPPVRAMRYVRSDELQQVFNFDLLVAPFDAAYLYKCISDTLEMLSEVNAPATWALSNHDTPRVASRHGANASRALALFVLALPGSCYIYNGQELGLPDAELADSVRQDPSFFRTKGVQKGRDGARVPMPWSGDKTPFGFSSGSPWLPIPNEWSEFSVDAQNADSASTLNLYRSALKIRKNNLVGAGEIEWVDRGKTGLLSFARGEFAIYLNTSSAALEISTVGTLVLGSNSEVTLRNGLLTLPAASASWVAIR